MSGPADPYPGVSINVIRVDARTWVPVDEILTAITQTAAMYADNGDHDVSRALVEFADAVDTKLNP